MSARRLGRIAESRWRHRGSSRAMLVHSFRGAQGLPDRGPSPAQAHPLCQVVDPEGAARLGSAGSGEVTEKQDGSLTLGQCLERLVETPDRLSLQEQPFRGSLVHREPSELELFVACGPGRTAGREGKGAHLASSQVPRPVDDDPDEPGKQTGSGDEAVDAGEGSNPGILDRVLGELPVTQNATRLRHEGRVVAPDHHGPRSCISSPQSVDEPARSGLACFLRCRCRAVRSMLNNRCADLAEGVHGPACMRARSVIPCTAGYLAAICGLSLESRDGA